MATEQPKSGDKYKRKIHGMADAVPVQVDVYSVLEAFEVRCPAVQHAVKKLLCAGIRGKGDTLQDLREAKDAIDRAISLHIVRENIND